MIYIKWNFSLKAWVCPLVANFAHRPPPQALGWGQKVNVHGHGHVAYQIKGKDECSNLQAHTLPLHALSTPGLGSKVKTFFSESSPVACQIKWNVA